jgi:LemA protein
MLFGLLVFGAIVLVLFSFVTTYNGLVAAAEKATRSWNDLDALLRQLHDEIPKLVEMCEPHLPQERQAFARIMEARDAMFASRQARDADALSRAGSSLRIALSDLMPRAAGHAELAMSAAFALVRQRYVTLDQEIAERRDAYNAAVNEYNAAKRRVPGSVVAVIGQFPALRALEVEGSAP